MASFLDVARISSATALRERALGAILSKARAVAAATNPALDPDTARFAVSVCLAPDQYVTPLARVIAATPVVQDLAVIAPFGENGYTINVDAITDAMISTACDSCWAAIAPTPVPVQS